MTNTAHLTSIEGATLQAWHTTVDLQAVHFANGDEALFFNGKRVPLHPEHDFWPSQTVINFCHLKKRAQKKQLAAWAAAAA